ncbi:hypothetical protein AKJ55_01015 [candidate division MSBL1 archaeon SCGC-AAA382M17]|uniref:Glycosyl transferase family 1 domain-containing protein n=1 Tax=candidate division MSBL1 archaeon SCGC-AAA382M17 TaxID=1698284 RepID=A0ABR5TJR0_9EURY|nr:hypothetical protein AKJ55_01015 [candidate division MSBL1 archaeon SCGC-AAA382M17]
MRAGVVPIVTNHVGAKEVVEKVDSNLVRDVNPKDLAEGIKNYIDLDKSRKKEMSATCRELTKKYREKVKVPEFKENFNILRDKISDGE